MGRVLKDMESVEHNEDLYPAQCWENVCVMTGVRPEAPWRRTQSESGNGATKWEQLCL